MSLSRQVLALLQFTRFALVFTAVSNALASMMLRAAWEAGPSGNWRDHFNLEAAGWMTLASIGLYGFGMSLNDIIDRRRDAQLAADRPLPSGRISLLTAHFISAFVLMIAGVSIWRLSHLLHDGWQTLIVALAVVIQIAFYDLAGKYLVAFGLVSLGLIRFLQAAIPAPFLPIVWHPLLLLNHVAILSTICYAWERKRPALTPKHLVMVIGMLVAIDVIVPILLGWRRGNGQMPTAEAMWLSDQLVWPVIAAALFALLAIIVKRRIRDSRAAGKQLMLYGLLWLIVYDAAFVAGHVEWWAGV
ncbi:MAG TPA: UbiA family prenyltransferase, partial [Tepidisphaeraceae bacterium]|nr:UbiA family prenyltransferase [Tepidisphaeraceae bacterium]